MVRAGSKLTLNREWVVGKRIGKGGFGSVYAVTSEGEEAAAKLVPKDPGADRELLFVDLREIRNVVPIIDSGETAKEWVLVMPRAERSLREYLEARGEGLDLEEAISILTDVAVALADLDGKVVHRDLKPENILLLGSAWCLGDFGISRYAEATTAPDTRKFSLTREYAAPERWRAERATSATDVYSFGIMAHEMLAGARPFPGPSTEEYRDQHLHSDPPRLTGVTTPLASLIAECLYKAPGARPTPENVARRLEDAAAPPRSGGLAKLREAHEEEVARRAEKARRESESRTEEAKRRELADSAGKAFVRIGDALRDSILEAAPAAQQQEGRGGWSLRLGPASLSLAGPERTPQDPWHWDAPPFTVICHAGLDLRIPRDRYGYEGRSHSLWFCDAQNAGEFAWFETAFMLTPLRAARARQDPFGLDPGEAAAKALWTGMAEYQVAWPFTRPSLEDLDEFIDRWAGWFAAAARGELNHPSTIPERPPGGSWRRG